MSKCKTSTKYESSLTESTYNIGDTVYNTIPNYNNENKPLCKNWSKLVVKDIKTVDDTTIYVCTNGKHEYEFDSHEIISEEEHTRMMTAPTVRI